jgi:hypothetical protein
MMLTIGVFVGCGNRFEMGIVVSTLYNTGHNKYKELLPTKLHFNLDQNLRWPRITDVISTIEQGVLSHL